MSDERQSYPIPTLAVPSSSMQRVMLYALRRMGAHGLGDAHAANALLATFGLSYRQPLILLRAFMAEIARASRRQIRLAPCCCLRMTEDEARLVAAISTATADPSGARRTIEVLTGGGNADPALSAARALSHTFADRGMVLEHQRSGA